ncbi:ThiF family adenylyltransferase [Actinomadura parmotrematis]|uniref:ThiF family adenylyltransferase n=1 Tax=Actinomadura parmotrematis TaxID=2864039 RepID=A0ABS7FUE6_9ACTN|nr:ThiF family adenylyltransferase [Actinomadura parmotrematis]MBW8484033.1 ThiF family adenylyltransferase [Actinomadura parmotrematis]
MIIGTSAWHVTAFRTPRGAPGAADTVAWVRALRARILFDGGRRPDFRDAAGAHVDDQDLDHGAWHFVGRADPAGPPLGYVRLCTADQAALFQTLAYLGPDHYARVLAGRGLAPDAVFEHSRLVVEHRARKLGLGVHLNATAVAAAHALGAAAMIGTSGTADGQDRFHARFGFGEVPGTRRYVERYTEDVVVMLHETARGAGEHDRLVRRLTEEFPGMVVDAVALPRPASAPAREEPAALRALPANDRESWRPELYRPAEPDERAALLELLDSGAVREVCDTLEDQLNELITSREPDRRRDAAALHAARLDQLAGAAPWEYGTWAFYPWSGRLVHLLPRDEFRLVRTDRNRGRVDRPEQRALLGARIGVIGLSVGNSAALTCALEGVGGAFRLADFDPLGLSNLNRLRAGVHQLGLNKTVIAARQMFEIDPYLDIEIFPAGLTAATMDAFFGADGADGGDRLDLLVEECDTPEVKIAARERARALGVPVVMDANDRGLLDVERFDLEPDRPLLHGLLGEISAAELGGLTAAERVDLILAMVDRDRISPALAAAVPEIGRTLSSWPQLASGVALGGALVTEAARRVLLGRPCPSGRYYTDLDEQLAADRSVVPAGVAR